MREHGPRRIAATGDPRTRLERLQVRGELAGIEVASLGIRMDRLVEDRAQIGIDPRAPQHPVTLREVGRRHLLQRAQLPEHRADREHIRALVDRLAALLLGRHVRWRAEDRPGRRQPIIRPRRAAAARQVRAVG
ncbi:MAG: hypothetical protein ABIY55_35570 [Kofleriaceae bacterium]